MACGLGATILFLMIISAQVRVKADLANDDLRAEATKIEQEVLDARKNLLRLRTETTERDTRASGAAGEIERLQKLIEELRAAADEQDNDSLAKKESVEQLRADVQRLQEGARRLAEATPQPGTGQRIRSFVGTGNRQYLTGMRMGGQRVLILVDSSASMLGRTYANVVRYRAMPDDRKVRAPKWRQTVDTVEWLTTQLQPGARFQIYTFNEQAATHGGRFRRQLDHGQRGQRLRPGPGRPAQGGAGEGHEPDQGLPGGAGDEARAGQHLPDHRRPAHPGRHARRPSPSRSGPTGARTSCARPCAELPANVPVNVILLPMEGDPEAAIRFWDLAMRTRGSFLAPAKDWP